LLSTFVFYTTSAGEAQGGVYEVEAGWVEDADDTAVSKSSGSLINLPVSSPTLELIICDIASNDIDSLDSRPRSACYVVVRTAKMADFATHYQHLNNDELLQLSTEHVQLLPDARSALNEDIRRRGLSRESVEQSVAITEEPTESLAPPVETSMNLSVLMFWLWELWLRSRTKQGTPVNATIVSTRRTEPGHKSGSRAEIRYSYYFRGAHYSGRAVRDFILNSAAAKSLVSNRKNGQTISVLVDPEHPEHSYYRTGFGWIEPLIIGLFALGLWAVLLLIVFGLIFKF